ncbi:hypothetical protein [Jatrophihabitans sp.]|uniref:hypothetical protein n=1 Tax=Jatrophihabitans sp. TaxID=1932789 RepID=UPI0030C6D9D5|nr:hypothetical protein [Jatrophihabitans sp.]
MKLRNRRVLALSAGVAASALVCACTSGNTPAPSSTVTVVKTPAASMVGDTQAAGSERFFSATSPWNVQVADQPVASNSTVMLSDASERLAALPETATGTSVKTTYRRVDSHLYINTTAWTVPVVSGGTPTSVVCRQVLCGDIPHAINLDVPADASPDPRYDGWFTILDRQHGVGYDLWRARREPNGQISFQYATKWQLKGTGYVSPGTPSARGSGLPLFAGLITPDELQQGLIQHALAISVPGPSQRYFVRPASMTDGNGPVGSLPEGARIRLRAGVTMKAARDPKTGKLIPLTAQQRRTADAITAALRTYGAIVVDRAAVPTLYAERGVSSALLAPNELQGFSLSDFSVVSSGTELTYPVTSASAAATNASSEGSS